MMQSFSGRGGLFESKQRHLKRTHILLTKNAMLDRKNAPDTKIEHVGWNVSHFPSWKTDKI